METSAKAKPVRSPDPDGIQNLINRDFVVRQYICDNIFMTIRSFFRRQEPQWKNAVSRSVEESFKSSNIWIQMSMTSTI